MLKVFRSLKDVDIGDALHKPLPLGPDGIRHGTLENGLTYYVRRCQKPKDRVAIALAVRIGSAVEEEHERGLAHVVEHLAFNATESYSNHDIVKFLEKIGAQFGACQNAYTTADETVYQLVVPTDKPELLGDALAVLGEFAFKIRCAEGDLKKERGAVLEEWRMSKDAAGRAQEAHWELIMRGSKYAERLPIGTEAVIKGAPASTVKAFYERWYRPENMAVVVVGDFGSNGDDVETESVVNMIRKHLGLGASRSSEAATAIPRYTFKEHSEPRCKVFVDKEAQDSAVYVSFKQDRRKTTTPAEFLDMLTELVFETALGSRLFKLSRESDPPFVAASAGIEPACATIQSFVISAVALEGTTLRALESVLTEVARVRQHGFHPREVARALLDLQSEIENTYLERDQGYCWDIRDEYLRHFLNNEFVTGQEYEARLSKTLLPRITKEAVEKLAQGYHPHCSCVVKVVEHRQHCTDEDVMRVVEAVAQAEASGLIEAWHDGDVPEHLMAEEPLPGAVVSERTFSALNATEFTLANGMRVCIKPTTFMEDEIFVTGTAFGGLSEVPKELFYTGSMSSIIAGQLGVFGYKPVVLEDILAGKRVEMDISEGAFMRSFKGVQSPADLETAFQLMHLLFVNEVKVDEKELDLVMKVVRQNIEAQLRNPLHHYHNHVRFINYGGCYYFEPIKLEDLERVDPHIACAHHNMNYHNPEEFVVVLTGNLEKETVLPLITKYLASIPATGIPAVKKAAEITPLTAAFPQAPVIEEVKLKMVSAMSQCQITFPVHLQRATIRADLIWVQLGCQLLETRLLQRMRFQYGDIYTVVVNPFFGCNAPSNQGDPKGDVSISFTCDPANRERLREMALEELETLQATGPSADEVATVVNLERLQHENSQQENSYWHEVLVVGYQSRTYQEVKDMDEVYQKNKEARTEVLAEAGPDSVKVALQRIFPFPCRSRYTAITMVPEPLPLLVRLLHMGVDVSQTVMKGCSSLCAGYWLGAATLAVTAVVAYKVMAQRRI